MKSSNQATSALHLVLRSLSQLHHQDLGSRTQQAWREENTTYIWSKRPKNLGMAMLHAEGILKGVAMVSGPSCPLHLGVLDSPDYWTDDALMSAVRSLNPEELHKVTIGSQQQRDREQGLRYKP